MPATRNQLLARIHCIRKERGWSEDEYRDILEARTGKRSAGDLGGAELARLVAALGGPTKPGKARAPHEWSWVDDAPVSKRPLLRKAIVLVGGAGIPRGGQVAYVEGIARQMAAIPGGGPVEKPLRMCDEGELWRIVAALAKHVRRHGQDPNAVGAG